MKLELRNQIENILVEPGHPGNIGSAARAMNNMGFTHLGLVNPVNPKDSDAYRMGWNSHEILDKANIYPDLPSALKDKGFVVIMSTRRGKDRGHFETLPDFVPEIYQMAAKTKVALLFGRESIGMKNEELFHPAERALRFS